MQEKYLKLKKFGATLLEKESLDDGLSYISSTIRELIGSDRCSIFLYDLKRHELSSTLSDGVEKIVVSSDVGLVGQTILHEKPIIENEPYGNIHFLPDIDMQTGYYTKNILTSPIFSSKREIMGVIELLNKPEGFHKKDMEFLEFFAHYISGFIELKHLI